MPFFIALFFLFFYHTDVRQGMIKFFLICLCIFTSVF